MPAIAPTKKTIVMKSGREVTIRTGSSKYDGLHRGSERFTARQKLLDERKAKAELLEWAEKRGKLGHMEWAIDKGWGLEYKWALVTGNEANFFYIVNNKGYDVKASLRSFMRNYETKHVALVKKYNQKFPNKKLSTTTRARLREKLLSKK